MPEATEPEQSKPAPDAVGPVTDSKQEAALQDDGPAEPDVVRAEPDAVPAGPDAAPDDAPVTSDRSPAQPPGVLPAPRRRRRRRALLASLVVLLVVLGAAVGAGGYYYQSVKMPAGLSLPATTTLYYADGTVLARLGDINRTDVEYENLLPAATQAAVAADDPDFWTDGGGPIARSVARTAFDIEDTGTSGRLRVFVLARKLSDTRSREEILDRYLNDSYFGRLTWGIEAAAREYFGKTADKTRNDVPQLSTAEAMVLVSMLDQPEPDPADPLARPGFDPSYSPKAAENSRNRWNEVREEMVKLRYLSSADAASLAYPTTRPYDEKARGTDLAKPSGLVVSHVLEELTASGSPFHGMSWRSIRNGGYSIATTLNPKAQEALVRSADATTAGSAMAGQPQNLQAAAVMVEPRTGRVLAYFGGSDGRGADYAANYTDESGTMVGFGAHPAGGSFLVHTLAAALTAGVSLNSYWSWRPYDMPGRQGANRIRNSSSCPRDRAGSCSLLDSTVQNLNVPYYTVTASISAAKVLEMARAAGIDAMWNDRRERKDLVATTNLADLVPSQFDTTLGLGQYPVTVLDQANAMATYAAGGLRAKAHFVTKVMSAGRIVYTERLPSDTQPRVLRGEVSADLGYALSQTAAGKLPGRDSASKTGTWEYSGAPDQNSNAWMVGYTSSLAMAVWIGNGRQEQAIKDKTGATIWGSGLPASIYRDVMNAAHEGMALRTAAFPPPVFAGATNPPGSRPS